MTTLRYVQRVFDRALVDTVDAWEIWRFLEAVKPFGKWIHSHLPRFRKGIDYDVFPGSTAIRVTYAVSLRMAEQLIIGELNAKGTRALHSLVDLKIQFMTALKSNALIVPVPDIGRFLQGPRQSLEYLMELAEGTAAEFAGKAAAIKQQAPNADEPDISEGPKGCRTIAKAAAMLGYSETDLIAMMIENGRAYWQTDDGVLRSTKAAGDARLLARI